MQIKRKDIHPQTTFSALEAGDVFVCEELYKGSLFMKCTIIESGKVISMAVDLEDGGTVEINGYQIVSRVKAHVVVE